MQSQPICNHFKRVDAQPTVLRTPARLPATGRLRLKNTTTPLPDPIPRRAVLDTHRRLSSSWRGFLLVFWAEGRRKHQVVHIQIQKKKHSTYVNIPGDNLVTTWWQPEQIIRRRRWFIYYTLANRAVNNLTEGAQQQRTVKGHYQWHSINTW